MQLTREHRTGVGSGDGYRWSKLQLKRPIWPAAINALDAACLALTMCLPYPAKARAMRESVAAMAATIAGANLAASQKRQASLTAQ
jgi:hypothetical protein